MADDEEDHCFQLVARTPWGMALERRMGNLFEPALAYVMARRRAKHARIVPQVVRAPFGTRIGAEVAAEQHAEDIRSRLLSSGESEATVERYLMELRRSIDIYDEETRQRLLRRGPWTRS